MKKRKSILLSLCIVILAAFCFIGTVDAAKGGGGCKDRDGDGYFQKPGCGTEVDCDDANAAVNPGAAEVCDDGIDNNCDGSVDEGCGGCTDNDGDGYGVNGDASCPNSGIDCDDTDAAVNPGASEVCGNGVDENCDGQDDICPGCTDNDGDGYGEGTDCLGPDCDDTDSSINPGASEVCDDNIDNNCDGAVDEGCGGCVPTVSKERDCDCFDNADNDCDGSIDSLDRDCKRETCDTCFDDDGDGWFTCGNDCDDSNPAINPGAPEVCNGIDDNCDGSLPIEEMDVDWDGVSICEGDCDDNNPSRYPGNTEGPFGHPVCTDGIDNDCDDLIDASDPDCADPCIDNDGDGYSPVGGSCGPVDCDDNNPNRSPGEQEGPFGFPSCSDGFDNDCDELIDSGDQDCAYTCTDNDGDGYGNPGDPTCPNGSALDCNDTDPNIHPGADDSSCNGVDDNCSGTADDGYVPTFTNCGVGQCASIGVLECIAGVLVDNCIPGVPETEGALGHPTCSDTIDNDCDGDTDGADTGCQSTCLDEDSDGYGYYGDAFCPNPGVDCNDNDPNINPGASEVCNGIDDNCDGLLPIDEQDVDWDGVSICEGDCDDNNPLRSPDEEEGPFGFPSCSDGLDNDCDDLVDSADTDCLAPCPDNDGDGSVLCDGPCDPAGLSCDCNDNNPNESPGNTEGPSGDPTCSDTLDNDCDNRTDLSDSGCCTDIDGDGYSSEGGPCGPVDCDDFNPNRSPGEQEGPFGSSTCVDGFDNDCDELVDSADQDCAYTCTDLDGDGYGNPGDPTCPNGSAEDCDDTDPLVFPGAPLICDAKDNNCDGFQDFPTDEDKDSDGVPRCASDCDDNDPNRYPGNVEDCNDGIDNDCDNLFDADDPDAVNCPCPDNDGDGYTLDIPECPTAEPDCDDYDAAVNPGAPDDNCDGVDNNCNGTPDDEYVPTPTYCGVGECASSGLLECQTGVEVDTCVPYPPQPEGPPGDVSCADAMDNDCDALTDSADPDCGSAIHTMYITFGVAHTSGGIDGQGMGDIPVSGTFKMYIENSTVVNIEDISISDDPSMLNWNDLAGTLTGIDLYLLAPSPDPAFLDTELNGTFDGNFLSMTGLHSDPCYDCYQYNYVIDAVVATDIDGDGYPPEAGDCDDWDANTYPGAPLLCDAKDNDCDGLLDFFTDKDADGDGVPLCAGDCDDINPVACCDNDLDGYGNAGGYFCTNGTEIDCNDNNPAVNPGATEGPLGDPTCSDIQDNDCDGLTDNADAGCI